MEFTDARELDPAEAERIAQAPLPTAATLRARRNIPLQLWKFGVFNLKSLKTFFGE